MPEYVIKSSNGNYIGIDDASGGYPYECKSIKDAQIWFDKEKPKQYKYAFPNEDWHLFTVKVEVLTDKTDW